MGSDKQSQQAQQKRPQPQAGAPLFPHDRLMALVQRLAKSQIDLQHIRSILPDEQAEGSRNNLATGDDWDAIKGVCGYGRDDFDGAGAPLPLTAAEIHHFCRNHRECDMSLGDQFAVMDGTLPESLEALYSVYSGQARVDAESTLFLAQASGVTRVARMMADLFALGGFNHADKSVFCEGRVYAVAAAFDTATVIDAANHEAAKRLALSADHPDHLLRLSPDDIGLLAAELVTRHRCNAEAFLKKANLLAEARQDVNRFSSKERLAKAIHEGDLPTDLAWVDRLLAAVRRIIPAFAGDTSDHQNPDRHQASA
ncbi:MAG: hypothetical protein WDO70_10450 [Alphaproteobacteria bacterium]